MKYIFIFLLAGCSHGFQVKELSIKGFEKEFNKFVEYSDQYENPHHPDNLIIVFGDLPSDKHGHCQVVEDISDANIITINKTSWDSFNSDEREMLILHEMGHCVLYRGHRDGEISSKPLSIMNTYMFNPWYYTVNKDYYLNELFTYK